MGSSQLQSMVRTGNDQRYNSAILPVIQRLARHSSAGRHSGIVCTLTCRAKQHRGSFMCCISCIARHGSSDETAIGRRLSKVRRPPVLVLQEVRRTIGPSRDARPKALLAACVLLASQCTRCFKTTAHCNSNNLCTCQIQQAHQSTRYRS